MYLKKFTVENVKCFADATLEFSAREDGRSGGWNVILGGNATGKTTLLQAMAATLVGPASSQRLMNPAGWVRHGATHGTLRAEFFCCDDDASEGTKRKEVYSPTLYVTGDQEITLDGTPYAAPQLVLGGNDTRSLVTLPYASSKEGWLTCGYGALRRFSGGTEDAEAVSARGREARVASLFRESVALHRGLSWLPQLYARSIDPGQSNPQSHRDDLTRLQRVLNQLLPEPVQIAGIDTRAVYFRAPGAPRVEMPELSDGYRSFLALVLDLLRQIDDAWGGLTAALTERDGRVVVQSSGVVLVDEIDLHLHPTWQRTIGTKLCEAFPNLQFIVTSHSPFIAQSASPGGLFVVRGGGADEPVSVFRPNYRVGGWRVEQILLSPLFGLTETRDPATESLLHRHAALIATRKWSGLPEDAQQELVAIEGELSERLTAPGEDLPTLRRERAVDAFIDETLKRFESGDAPTRTP